MPQPAVVSMLVLACLAIGAAPSSVRYDWHEIAVTAKKYEYAPTEIRVKKGEQVRLRLTAMDRKHGIEITELGVRRELEKGEEAVVEFIPDKAGEFDIHCIVFCGFGHGKMHAKLIVEPE